MSSEKYRELSKNTLLFSISSFGTKIISFLLVPLYTSALSTSDYGNVDILNTTISLLLPVLTINIQDAVLRFSLDKEYDSRKVISSGCQVVFLGSALLWLVLVIFRLTDQLVFDNSYLIYFALAFPLSAFQNVLSMYLRSKDYVKVIVVSGLFSTTLLCVLNVVFLLVFRMGVNGYLLSTLIASTAGILIYLCAIRPYRDYSVRIDRVLIFTMLSYSAPLIINSLSWWLNDASDRYILSFICGTDVNGVYAVAYKIPLILSTLQGVFYNAWSVSAIKEFDKDDRDGFIGSTYTLYSCVSILGCSALLFLNPLIARFLYMKEFYEAYQYTPILLIGTVFYGLALFEGCLYTAVKKTRGVAVTTIIGAVCNTALNILLIPHFGAYGASIVYFGRKDQPSRLIRPPVTVK